MILHPFARLIIDFNQSTSFTFMLYAGLIQMPAIDEYVGTNIRSR